MISRTPLRWLATVSATAVAALAAAQAPQAPPAADAPALPPRYEVELIVFANSQFDPGEERFDDTLNGLGTDPL
ncbi:MAG TPA: hypothetical protein VKA43_14400, partial [Gammaproteobacteria bacterium]|nr:hypothetical protein [Gammaproteobacteria bacterium]